MDSPRPLSLPPHESSSFCLFCLQNERPQNMSSAETSRFSPHGAEPPWPLHFVRLAHLVQTLTLLLRPFSIIRNIRGLNCSVLAPCCFLSPNVQEKCNVSRAARALHRLSSVCSLRVCSVFTADESKSKTLKRLLAKVGWTVGSLSQL